MASVSGESDDETPQLSAHALQALQEFYAEQSVQSPVAGLTEEMPSENWQLSQFWYSSETADLLAREALEHAGENGSIACVSCPTLYHKLREEKPQSVTVHILEYDERFQQYGEDFVFYDYKNPLEIPKKMEHFFDVVVADPPFLSEECLTKTALTVRFLAKHKILLCTGSIMKDLAQRLLHVKECGYKPKHTRNLANEFSCFSNFSPKHLNVENS